MKFCKTIVVLLFGFAAMMAGCRHKDKAVKNGTDAGRIYFDYTVTGEENGENVTCLFQYKSNDIEGNAIDVEPGKVEVDGQIIQPDSTKLSGAFYEIQKPVDSFAGKHSIVFTNEDGKAYKNEFEFFPFSLAEELPEKVNRKPFVIQLKNFPGTERSVRLLMLDTAFASKGFNDMVPVINGKINIDESILRTIKNGPINFELYLEQELPLNQVTRAGGKISITYGLKREFELVGGSKD